MATATFYDKIDTSKMVIEVACRDLQGTWKPKSAPMTFRFDGLECVREVPFNNSEDFKFDPGRVIGVMEIDGNDAVLFFEQEYGRKFPYISGTWERRMPTVSAYYRDGDRVVGHCLTREYDFVLYRMK